MLGNKTLARRFRKPQARLTIAFGVSRGIRRISISFLVAHRLIAGGSPLGAIVNAKSSRDHLKPTKLQ
jgi:hypothetical protein